MSPLFLLLLASAALLPHALADLPTSHKKFNAKTAEVEDFRDPSVYAAVTDVHIVAMNHLDVASVAPSFRPSPAPPLRFAPPCCRAAPRPSLTQEPTTPNPQGYNGIRKLGLINNILNV